MFTVHGANGAGTPAATPEATQSATDAPLRPEVIPPPSTPTQDVWSTLLQIDNVEIPDIVAAKKAELAPKGALTEEQAASPSTQNAYQTSFASLQQDVGLIRVPLRVIITSEKEPVLPAWV